MVVLVYIGWCLAKYVTGYLEGGGGGGRIEEGTGNYTLENIVR